MKKLSLRERLEKYYHPEPNSGCWLWLGHLPRDGYGKLTVGSSTQAYKASYVFYKGEYPKNLELDHTCRTPSCVNPDHLEAVTHKTNMERGTRATSTHCKNGHPLDEENTYIFQKKNGYTMRQCRTCNRNFVKEYHLRRRVEITTRQAAWYQANKERIKAKGRAGGIS